MTMNMEIHVPTSQSKQNLEEIQEWTCPVMTAELVDGQSFRLQLSDDSQHGMDKPLPRESPFKNPQCCLKQMVHLPTALLEGDFQALSRRMGSTSTPFVSRTSTDSDRQVTPCFSESSLSDSAIDTTCGRFSSLLNGSVFLSAKPADSRRLSAEAEPSNNIKTVLFPLASSCDKCSVECLRPCDSQDVAESKHVQSLCCSNGKVRCNGDTVHDCALRKSESSQSSFEANTHTASFDSKSSPSFLFSHSTESTPDTGYESQLGADSSRSSLSPISLCINHFAPKQLDRLIGRKIGLDHVNIISHLSYRNLILPLNMILQHLNKQELKIMCMVSPDWSSVVYSDLHACKMLAPKSPRKMSAEKENCCQRKKSECKQLTTSTGSVFSVLQATGPTQPCSSTSMSDEAQHVLNLSKKYWKEAEWLKNEECLRKCPKCSMPAKVNPAQERAWCSNKNCTYDFCIQCHSAFHGSKDCGLKVSAKKQKTCATVGSKHSKKNLKRL